MRNDIDAIHLALADINLSLCNIRPTFVKQQGWNDSKSVVSAKRNAPFENICIAVDKVNTL